MIFTSRSLQNHLNYLIAIEEEEGGGGQIPKIRIKPKMARTIGFFSAKGGVGKTTTAINIATLLAEEWGGGVLLVDANLTAPNVSIYLGEFNPDLTIHHVLSDEASIKETIKKVGKLDVIYGSTGFGEISYRVDLGSYLQPLTREYRAIFIDTAPGLGSEAISALRACDEMVIVTTPDYPSVASTLQTFRAAEEYKVSLIGIVINKVLGEKFEISTKDIKKTFGWPIISSVPNDVKVLESVSMCIPVVQHAPKSPAAKEFMRLAKLLRRHISKASQ